MKKVVIGLIIGVIVAFPLGYNFGRGVPLLTNPFARRSDLSGQVEQKAAQVVESTKAAIHKATAPERKELNKK